MAPEKKKVGSQPSLLSFFGKPKASGSNASGSSSPASASRPAAPSSSGSTKPKPSTSVASTSAKKALASNAGSSVNFSDTPATSEGDAMEVEDSNAKGSSSQSAPPAKRLAPVESDDEDDAVVHRKKRASTSKAKIADSDDSDVEVVESGSTSKPKASSKSKAKGKADNDAFSGSASSESEDYFNDDMDDHLEEAVEIKPKVKAAPPPPVAKKVVPASRPVAKASTSSGTGKLKTQAETAKQNDKDKKAVNASVFSFLRDPKDADGIRPGEEGYDPRTLKIPAKAWADFTPFETQFWEIKQNHYDTVLFFQKGKFFELYEEDASIGHREFDLKLTDRVKMKMVGVPESSFDFWAAKFVAQGYKVGRVEQCETALGAEMRVKDGKASGKVPAKAPAKSIVRRELKSVLTAGTLVDGSMLTDDLASHCVSIKEYTPTSSSPPTFGVCVLDAATAEFALSDFEDDTCRTQLETLIRQLKPKELIHEKGNLSVSTLRMLRNALSVDCQWSALKTGTEFLEPDATKDELNKLFTPKPADEEEEMEVEYDEETIQARIPETVRAMYDKPAAMSALGGMLWYLRQLNLESDLVTAKNFKYYDPLSEGKALVLDGQTLAHIEVLQNSSGGIEGTLFQLLSRCVTPFGKRQFKLWLCSPLRDAAEINQRLDAVEDLLANPNFAATFDKLAKALPDLERLLSRVHAKSCKKKEFLKVVSSFEAIVDGLQALAISAEDFKSQTITKLLQAAPDISETLENIKQIYDGEELLPVEGQDEGYETVRQNVEDIENSLHAALKQYKKDLGCSSLIFKDIGTKDIYQIEVPVKIKAPKTWTQMSSTKQVNRYYSAEVQELVQDLKEARERKTKVVNDFQFKVFGEFDKDYEAYMATVKVLARLDCLLSLSKSSSALGEPCVRPEIVESDTAIIEFEELRHPCINSSSTDFIPNDVKLGGDAEQMILLTGPNMAGKSTMLRMTCAAIIMAQIGCFVPAAKAKISPVDAIYSRMGANDAIFANASTFKVEMDDCRKILTKATPRSLVILDELGRGTSTYDGMAIAFAVLHRLATHVGCIGFFATHFTSLTEDFAYHPQIRLCNMQTDLNGSNHSVVFLYKLINGASEKSYGPHVAKMAGLPDVLVNRAILISKQFETSSRARERAMRASERLPLTSQADAAFLLKFVKMGLDEMKEEKVGQLLRTLKIIRDAALVQKQFVEPVAAIEVEEVEE